MDKAIVIIGADGQLGSELIKAYSGSGRKIHAWTITDLDITDYNAVQEKIKAAKPEIVINTAAFHKTDECEKDLERSFKVNCFAVNNLAKVCRENNAVLVSFSSDYVFNGRKGSPYTEQDTPDPLNVYGLSKYAGEKAIQKELSRYFIVRTSYMFGSSYSREKGGNIVETFIKLGTERELVKAAEDHIVSPTYAKALAETVRKLVETGKYGLYHAVSEGKCSMYEFAEKIFQLEGLKAKLEPAPQEELNKGKAERPLYSALENAGLKMLGISMPSWEDALIRYIKERKG